MKVLVLFACLICLPLFAQASRARIAAGSRVYIDAGDFTEYMATAIQAKNVPLTITVNRETADYIITGSHVDSAKSLGMNHDAASINLIDKSGDVIWSKSITRYGVADMRGAQTIAGSLAKHLKDFIAGK